jgi:hypothetical protein
MLPSVIGGPGDGCCAETTPVAIVENDRISVLPLVGIRRKNKLIAWRIGWTT